MGQSVAKFSTQSLRKDFAASDLDDALLTPGQNRRREEEQDRNDD